MESAVLIGFLNNGNEAGLIGIYRLYYKSLIYFVQRYIRNQQEAEEIVSDAFIKLWERRDNFTSLERVKAFLYICAKNRCLNALRGTSILKQVEDIEDYEQALSEDPEALVKIVRTELFKAISEEIQRLPEKQRDVLTMIFVEDMSIDEISQQLRMTPSAIYANKSRALATLREKFDALDMLFILAALLELRSF